MSELRIENSHGRRTPTNAGNLHPPAADAAPVNSARTTPGPESSSGSKNSGPKKKPEKENKKSQLEISQAQQQYLHSHAVAANFGNIVTVLMQSPQHKDCSLSELKDIVLPALKNNQFKIAQAHRKDSGYTIPIGIVLWARVSEAIDNKLSSTQTRDVKLSAKEWVSGDKIWIIEAVGEQRAVSSLINALRQKAFNGQTVKYRYMSEDGVEIKTLEC